MSGTSKPILCATCGHVRLYHIDGCEFGADRSTPTSKRPCVCRRFIPPDTFFDDAAPPQTPAPAQTLDLGAMEARVREFEAMRNAAQDQIDVYASDAAEQKRRAIAAETALDAQDGLEWAATQRANAAEAHIKRMLPLVKGIAVYDDDPCPEGAMALDDMICEAKKILSEINP